MLTLFDELCLSRTKNPRVVLLEDTHYAKKGTKLVIKASKILQGISWHKVKCRLDRFKNQTHWIQATKLTRCI